MANLDQIITPDFLRAMFFQAKSAGTPIFIVLVTDRALKTNLDQIITPEKAKLGPASLALSGVIIWST